MKFHFNEVALRHTAQSRLPDREGRLSYRSYKGAYKERWFRLHGNLLFYFRTNDFGAVADHDPVGVFVLAKFSAEMEQIADRPFVFTIAFEGEEGRKHYFSGQTMQQCLDWVGALQKNSYEAVRMKYESLRREVHRLTGKDPVKERLALSSKQKLRSESRQTKFYYDSGLDSCDGLVPAKSALERKSVRPAEPQNTKPVERSKPDLRVNLSEQKPLPENSLITLSPTDVQKSISVDPLSTGLFASNPIPVLPFDVANIRPATKPLQSTMVQSSAIQPVVAQMPLSQPVAYHRIPFRPQEGLASAQAAQPNMVRVPIMSFRTSPIVHSDIPRMSHAVSSSSEGVLLQQNIVNMPSIQPMSTQWRQHGAAPQVSFVPTHLSVPVARQNLVMTSLDTRLQPSVSVDKTHGNSFVTLQSFPASVGNAQQAVASENSAQHTRENSLCGWHSNDFNKSQTSPELMSFHRWETFDE